MYIYLKENDIFLSETDSIGNVKWKITDQDYTQILINLKGKIIKELIIPNDSFSFYDKKPNDILSIQITKNNNSFLSKYYGSDSNEYKSSEFNNDTFLIDFSKEYDWINIDKLALIDDKKNIQFNSNNSKINRFNIYLVYEKTDAFLTYQR